MKFEFAQQINPHLTNLNFDSAISIGETALKKLPTTPYHSILGKTLIDQADSLIKWTDEFYQLASKYIDIKALYFEMNEFDINTDMWYIDCFAFTNDGGLNEDDMEWLTNFQADSQSMTETEFVIQGLEDLQNAFEIDDIDNDNLQDARDWSEQLVIARFMELMRTAHLKAKQKQLAWATLPIYFTEHSYDFIVQSRN